MDRVILADEKNIKKHFGEEMWHFCRATFPTILEKEGELYSILSGLFAPSHNLYYALSKDPEERETFIATINLKFQKKNGKEDLVAEKNPEQLFAEVGYKLYPECKTEKDIQSFKKYYSEGEELCTFRGGRLEECRVWFAVKNGAEKLDRKSFRHPQRQDEYGTSVISIQFSRGAINRLSIKNRYNHSVQNPDATFENNLDLINLGLAKAFEKYEKVNICEEQKEGINLPHFVIAKDGKFYHYNLEINGKYFCDNNIVINRRGEFEIYNPDKYLLINQYLINFAQKNIYAIENLNVEELEDPNLKSFFDYNEKFESIEISKQKFSQIKHIDFKRKNGQKFRISVNNCNSIVAFSDHNLTELFDTEFYDMPDLELLDCPNLKKIGNHCFMHIPKLKKANLQSLQVVGDSVFVWADMLEKIELDNLQTVGDSFLHFNGVKNFYAPKLEEVGENFMNQSISLKSFVAPSLKVLPCWSLNIARELESFEAESLTLMKSSSLQNTVMLNNVYAPNLVEIGKCCMEYANQLQKLDLPKLEIVGHNSLQTLNHVKDLNFQNLSIVGQNFLFSAMQLKTFVAPKLVILDDSCLFNAPALESVYVPSLEYMDSMCLFHSTDLKKMYAPKLIQNERKTLKREQEKENYEIERW